MDEKKINPQRFARKLTCAGCKGRGEAETGSKRPCVQCKGKGWTLDGNKNPIVCIRCNGESLVPEIKKCDLCSSMGFTVEIVEQSTIVNPCNNCNESGQVSISIVCSECQASGWLERSPKEHCGVYSRSRCEKCEGKGKIITYHQCQTCRGKTFINERLSETIITPSGG
jgi:DnaJ-class molecular chaperone